MLIPWGGVGVLTPQPPTFYLGQAVPALDDAAPTAIHSYPQAVHK